MNKILKVLLLAGLFPALASAEERNFALKLDAARAYVWGVSVMPASRAELEWSLHEYFSVFGIAGGFAWANSDVNEWETRSGIDLELGLRYWPISEKAFEGPSVGLSARKYFSNGILNTRTGADSYASSLTISQSFAASAELAWQKVFDGRWIANLTLLEEIYTDDPVIYPRNSPIAIPVLHLKAGVLW